MKRQKTLVLPQKVADQLRHHLFPGDGLEAAALLLCAQAGERRKKLLGREIIAVPYNRCARTRDSITWPGEYVEAAIDRAALRGDVGDRGAFSSRRTVRVFRRRRRKRPHFDERSSAWDRSDGRVGHNDPERRGARPRL